MVPSLANFDNRNPFEFEIFTRNATGEVAVVGIADCGKSIDNAPLPV